MRRGEVWVAQVGGKRRPVLVVTRSEVLEVRNLVTVAEVTTQVRGLAAEVRIDRDDVPLDQASVINCDGLHTVAQSMLASRVGEVGDETMAKVGAAVSFALGC